MAVPTVLDIARELVRIPSESSDPVATDPAAPEAAAAKWLAELFSAHGLDAEMRDVAPGRPNVVLRLPRPGAPRVMIAGHLDTVSAKGMDRPFDAHVRDGNLYGRGACDDKGPLAAAIHAFLRLKENDHPSPWDLTFAATVGEEVNLLGAGVLAEAEAPFDLALILEPTRLAPVDAHKGVLRFTVETKGRACHSSRPEEGVNAILAMQPVLARLEDFGKTLPADDDPRLGRATLAVTGIRGGTAVNIIPDRCAADVDLRLLPGMNGESVLEQIRQILGADVTATPLFIADGMRTKPDGPAWISFCNSLQSNRLKAETEAVAYATDASKLSVLGPCIVWGPGDIAQAHSRVEFISTEALESASRILFEFLQPQ